jgi:hypothetical protein
LLRSLDLRQMKGEPGFFGSYGFKSWAGVGEAKPNGVMHELSHSYWGGFPVAGFPSLSWDTMPGEHLSPAMQQYRADILSFMAQPPDGYEVFRQRLRNLPALSDDNLEPLFHSMEADLVYSTGGDLALAPPVLRKYWVWLIEDGPFNSWYDAIGWYRALSPQDLAAANKYLGFEHLDLRQYRSLRPSGGGPANLQAQQRILDQEERQRLFDLADQFDLLLGGPQKEEKFQFWRGYLRDKLELHRAHPGYLASLNLPRAADLAGALEFVNGLRGDHPASQSQRISRQLADQLFLVNLLPALDNRTLLSLFAIGTQFPTGPTLQATASFVERLDRFSKVVDRVLAKGRDDPRQGAGELKLFLAHVPFEPVDDIRLFFELFQDADPAAARAVMRALDKETVRRLMAPAPFHLRTLLTSEELLDRLDITAQADVPSLRRGITTLMQETSGNYIVDEPFLHRMYAVMAARAERTPQETLRVLRRTFVPLEGFIQTQPQAAVAVLASDLDSAALLVANSDPVVFPPARVIYRLIYADPELAARLTLVLADRGGPALVMEVLAHFAYDKDRLERAPSLPISLERDGRFLEALLRHRSAEWLETRLAAAFGEFGQRSARGEVGPDFLAQYRATLEAAAATLPDRDSRTRLQAVVHRVAAPLGGGR